ncbi:MULTISPECIES: bifunctional aminoglycoside phosphotransferase/ATP-binding protein [Methylomonas]|uniref:bifunctional aminoglycoside phosphotransferase/ATP-binding protein n=1 Tax=Methylomonas TaxID=416 RepID=UPI001232E53D|nr:bifunctional aminoglycoside phosphotransferase/ATP-binding protein [Methylomonas rhizoryzae]
MNTGELDDSLIQALMQPNRYPYPVSAVERLETHISWLLLAGDYVYKIKKPVDFGFLDFSSLERRRFFCQEELRLNRRLAPTVYLDVIPIGGSPVQPEFGCEPAIEYAVKMCRFAETDLLDHKLQQNALTNEDITALAETLAVFHAELPPAAAGSDYGTPDAIAVPARQNFEQLVRLLGTEHQPRLSALRIASESEFQRCRLQFAERLHAGNVKECHGDLHLGNIVMLNGRPTPFDGIDFNPNLRWIDVINDIAFLVMDLQFRQRSDLAYGFLNAYLQYGGDYPALQVLHFYLGYRAMVMAKVGAIRSAQQGGVENGRWQRYLQLAEDYYAPVSSRLLITKGLPGCGKTTVSQQVLEQLPAIRIRSDVERKRLFGMAAEQRSGSPIDGGIYTQAATEKTYDRLLELSRLILQSGFSVIVDAAFLRQAERCRFADLANECGVEFMILDIDCPEPLLIQRIQRRQIQAQDASEADLAVYRCLKAFNEPIAAQERPYTLSIHNGEHSLAVMPDGLPLLTALQRKAK